MASPRELVECVSDVLKAPLATVTVHDRNLAIAGLRTISGRGRAVAAVTADDAANLLIAVIASEQVRDSAAAVRSYGALVSKGSRLFDGVSNKLNRRHVFREAIAELIALLMNDALKHGGGLTIGVKFELPEMRSGIDFNNDLGNPLLRYTCLGSGKSPDLLGDLTVEKNITQVTLFTIAALISKGTEKHARDLI